MSRGQKSIYSEYGDAARNATYDNIEANILILHIPQTLGVGSKLSVFFSENGHVAYPVMGGGGGVLSFFLHT